MKKNFVGSLVFLAAAAALDARAAVITVASLEELAIELSRPQVAGQVLSLEPGTYNLTSTITIPSGVTGVTITSRLGKDKTVIQGDSTTRLMSVEGQSATVSGITFKGGYSATNGGAISFSSSSVSQTATISNCDFVDCTAKYGGAIYAGKNSYSSFLGRESYGVVSGCTFLRCGIATVGNEGAGGAIFGALWVEDSVFDACFCSDTTKNQYHAAIDVTSYSTVTNCVFRNHTQTKRGLVGSNEDAQQLGCARLLDCLVANNVGHDQDDVLFHRKVILDRCVISNNETTVTSKLAGIYRLDADGDRGFSRITSCLFIDNKYPFKMDVMPPLVNCTFVRNVGGLACDYLSSLKFAVTNCVFWGNIEKTDWPFNNKYKGVPGIYWHPSTPLEGLIQIANTVVQGGSSNTDVMSVLAADPSGASTAATALADSKGPGFTDAENGAWSLKKSSVLIDRGTRADWMSAASDMAGNARCLRLGYQDPNALPDIGCYEYCAALGFYVSLR